MTDEELGKVLAPDWSPEMQQQLVAKLTPKARDTYARLFEMAEAINRGEMPAGVIVCPKRKR